jgi:hypothetical protein
MPPTSGIIAYINNLSGDEYLPSLPESRRSVRGGRHGREIPSGSPTAVALAKMDIIIREPGSAR